MENETIEEIIDDDGLDKEQKKTETPVKEEDEYMDYESTIKYYTQKETEEWEAEDA